MAEIQVDDQIKALIMKSGACDIGFSRPEDAIPGLPYAVSIVIPLSDAVIDEITDRPTYSYFHHYRTVNAQIDRLLLQIGLLLQGSGWCYLPIAASQSVPPESDTRTHRGRYSHKKAAVAAGLGTIGKSTLFLHRKYGARVRLGTLFTDFPLPVEEFEAKSACGACDLCARHCPAGAIKGTVWHAGSDRSDLFDAEACNTYMRTHFMKIGRGSVCGICVKVCPYNQTQIANGSLPLR